MPIFVTSSLLFSHPQWHFSAYVKMVTLFLDIVKDLVFIFWSLMVHVYFTSNGTSASTFFVFASSTVAWLLSISDCIFQQNTVLKNFLTTLQFLAKQTDGDIIRLAHMLILNQFLFHFILTFGSFTEALLSNIIEK